MRRRYSLLMLCFATSFSGIAAVWACPFCSSVSQTLTEEISSMQVVVVAQLVEAPPRSETGVDPSGALPKAKFVISDVIKGTEFANKGDEIEVLYFGEPNKDRPYLMMGTDPPRVAWTTPLGLSQRAYEYVRQLPKLPSDNRRLEFFQEYLEDEDEILARDAYDEFAKAPYADVVALKEQMNHDRLVDWVKDRDVPASRRRLYFTMLGVCGTPEDAPLLQGMMRSDVRQEKAGLDALIACYLILNPKDGLSEVNNLFLKNKKAEYADTYSAIMAIRFHGNDMGSIKKQRLIESLRYLLERPELADLVIPDLARWKDWDVMPRMVQLFKDADDKSSWVRVPVINYLRSCPLPEAKEYIDELKKIDPDAVKRAQTFFPFDAEGDGGAASEATDEKSSSLSRPPAGESPEIEDRRQIVALPTVGARIRSTRMPFRFGDRRRTAMLNSPRILAEREPRSQRVSQVDAAAAESYSARKLNRWTLIGVPTIAGVVLMLLLRAMLGYPLVVRGQA